MNNQYQQIIDTGNAMIEQNNRGTQYPLFAIQDDFDVYVEPGEDYDRRQRPEDIQTYWLCDACSDLYNDGETLPDDCDDCDEDAFEHFRVERRLTVERVGVFFTEKAATDHIIVNSYHYKNPSVYAIAAWRNPEMVAVMQQIIKTTDKPIPSHYA